MNHSLLSTTLLAFFIILPFDAGASTLINLGRSAYNGYCLNVRGDTGRVTAEKIKHSGCRWNIERAGAHIKVGKDGTQKKEWLYRLINLGKSKYNGWYLNLTRSGELTVVPNPQRGTTWRIVKARGRQFHLINKGRYLNVRKDGNVTVVKKLFSGTYWAISDFEYSRYVDPEPPVEPETAKEKPAIKYISSACTSGAMGTGILQPSRPTVFMIWNFHDTRTIEVEAIVPTGVSTEQKRFLLSPKGSFRGTSLGDCSGAPWQVLGARYDD